MARLANFCHLFPGHTPMNIRDMQYREWEALAAACDDNTEKLKAQRTRRGK